MKILLLEDDHNLHESLKAYLEMEDFDAVLKVVHKMIVKNTTAKSALEIALYDLEAQAAKQQLNEVNANIKEYNS